MSDLFHKDVPDGFIQKVFETMRKAHWHTFQILTKRPERMEHFTNEVYTKVLPNVWLGATIENREALYRLGHIKKTRAMVKFISFEPLLGPLGKVDLDGIGWVIVGGESGPGHRPMKKEWVIDIKNQTEKAYIPFFFKQWGGLTPKSNGRSLDGKIYSQYPRNEKGLFYFKDIYINGGFHAKGECAYIGRISK
jgi:protein gp37